MYSDTGTITGTDARMGMCEGGTYIRINGHPNPNSQEGLYDIGSLPSTFKISPLMKYPINVTLDYTVAPECYGNYINISRIAVIN